MNENDSELIAGLLNSAGHQPVSCLEQADIIVVNTCCVRQSAENRALGFIGSLEKNQARAARSRHLRHRLHDAAARRG